MNINQVNRLFETGAYSDLLNAGFISPKLAVYREIYLYVDAQVKTRDISKTAAALEAEVKFRIGIATVWRALSVFSA